MKFKISRTSFLDSKKPCDESISEKDFWIIEIKTLEELIEFYKKYGTIILEKRFHVPELLEIEIYDCWRE